MHGGAALDRPGADRSSIPSPDPDSRWEVDLLPAPISIGTAPHSRVACVLVMGDGFILFSDFLTDPPSESDDVARVLIEAVEKASTRVGRWPRTIAVRREVIARELRPLLGERHTSVTTTRLPEVDEAGRSLMAHMNPGSPERPLGLSIPDRWGSWGLPTALVGELFAASAAFFRDRPWERLVNADLMMATTPGGTSWTMIVLGGAGMEYGVALYADLADLESQLTTESADPGWEDVVLSLTFLRRSDVSPAMRKEVLAAGWEVAGTDAWPFLITANTPGGGITRAQATDLRDILRALPEFSRFLASARAEGAVPPIVWTDPEMGVSLVLESDGEEPSLWPPPVALEPALPTGLGANPASALLVPEEGTLSRDTEELVDRFQESLSLRFSAATAFRHADNADLFLTYLSDAAGIPVEAVTECDLIIFLFDWVHRTVVYPPGEMRAIPVSLKRFFHFLETEQELLLPWAWKILEDREAFDIRAESCPGGGFAFLNPDLQEWVADLGVDLAARVFLPNPAMADGGVWGEMMEVEEATLFHELRRRWLIWRDEVIASGVTSPGEVREELARRQAAWERSPHPRHKGRTPLQVVHRERKRLGGEDRW